MADALQRAVAREGLELAAAVGVREIDPADDAADPGMFVREGEQPARFGHVDGCLHGDGAVESAPVEQRPQIRRQIVALEDRHRAADPGMGRRRIAPEVLVSVEAHGAQPRRRA
jgi:hypothetical protein